MRVLVKFYVFDLPPGFADAELDIREGADVSDVLEACLLVLDQRGVAMDPKELRTATVMVNGRWSDTADPVNDGDTVTVIRPMDGG